jgi:uncharacterized protein
MHSSIITRQRIITVDALRGFALLGILFSHFIYWYSGAGLPQEVYSKFNDAGSNIASLISGVLISGKFFTFFSFLFGLSFYLQMDSLKKNNENFVIRYLWRLIILGVIGLIHHAIWRGDILSIYVPLGFILLLIRNISNRLLLLLAFLLIINVPVRVIEIVHLFEQKSVATVLAAPPSDDEAQRYYDIIKSGSLKAMLIDNWKALNSKFGFQFGSGRIYITLGFFMLGMYVGRKKWFESPTEAKSFIKRICKISGWISLGIILFMVGIFITNSTLQLGLDTNKYINLLFSFLFDTANSSLTIFYLTGLTMLMYRIRGQKILYPFAPVGKMALTVYVSQTLFGLLLFYNFGFHLFLKTSPGINIILAIPVFIIQSLFCRWWLKYFNYGPIEWLWRSLTFFTWYPLRRKESNILRASSESGNGNISTPV